MTKTRVLYLYLTLFLSLKQKGQRERQTGYFGLYVLNQSHSHASINERVSTGQSLENIWKFKFVTSHLSYWRFKMAFKLAREICDCG